MSKNNIDDFLGNPEPLESPKTKASDNLGESESKAFQSAGYDIYQERYIEIVLDNLTKEAELRGTEFKKLSNIAITWTITIIVITLLNGFGGFSIIRCANVLTSFPVKLCREEYLKFNLTDPSYIALVTTTTATILGLYSIAAYWLYRKDALTFDFLKKTDDTDKK